MRTTAGDNFPRSGETARQVICAISLCLASALASGCGKGGPASVPREDVSGTVNFDGKPVPFGFVKFQNDEQSTISKEMQVTNGAFSSASGEGPAAGMNQVYVTGNQEEEGMPLWQGAFKTTLEIKKGKNSGTEINIDKKAVKPFDPKRWSDNPHDRG